MCFTKNKLVNFEHIRVIYFFYYFSGYRFLKIQTFLNLFFFDFCSSNTFLAFVFTKIKSLCKIWKT